MVLGGNLVRRYGQALVAAVALLASGCREIADALLTMEVQTEEVCRTQPQVLLLAPLPGQRVVRYVFVFPLGQVGSELPPGSMESSLWLHRFELRVAPGGVDLRAVERASVSLRRLGASEPIRTLAEQYRTEQPATAERLELRGLERVVVPDLVREQAVELILELEGTLPQEPWRVDLEACAGWWARVHHLRVVF
jgi:hypothetical protein